MSRNNFAENTDLLHTSDGNLKEQTSLQNSKLKRHYPAILLIAVYIPLVIIPWTTTVALSYHPLSRSTYYYTEGFSMEEYKKMQSWVTAINVLNSVASILALPVVSFVIAQTAVVYSQRRVPARQLSVRDVFAFADRAWTDISVLFKLIRAKGRGSRPFNSFVALASGLLFISALQPPLYQILVDWKSINIPSRIVDEVPLSDTSSALVARDKVFIGGDAEPTTMEMIPHDTIVKRVQFELPSIRSSLPEMYMWIDYNGTQPPPSPEHVQGDAINTLRNVRNGETPQGEKILPAFFSAFPFNATTGTRRYHVMRLNSTIECESLSTDEFPTECSGSQPFNSSMSVPNSTTSSELRICVPGQWGVSPWTLSRNRQDIKEEVYLQLLADSGQEITTTIRCSSATTRGYFELGNYRTKGAYGPLLEHWPSPDIIEGHFNDQGIFCESGSATSCNSPQTYVPTERDTMIDRVTGWTSDEPEYMRWNASGPLVTSVMALFGDDSWIRTAGALASYQANSTTENETVPAWWKPFCERQPLFHSNITQCDTNQKPTETVAQWLSFYFGANYVPSTIEDLIFTTMVSANKAVLLTHRDTQAPRLLYLSNSRSIYSSSGFSILKPDVSLASIVVISALLAIQVAGLMLCSIYIARTPTWTRVFNAMSIARIGAGLEKDKLPVDGQYAEDEDYERLRAVQIPLGMASADALRRRIK